MKPKLTLIQGFTLIACAAALLVAAPASAASQEVSGKGADPRGDSPLQGDVVKVAADYRAQGQLQLQLAMADQQLAAEQGTVIVAGVGRRQNGTCSTEEAGTTLTYDLETGDATSFFLASEGARPRELNANATVSGNTITLEISSGILARRGYDCAVFIAIGPAGEEGEDAQVLDRAEARLRTHRHPSHR